MRTIEKIHTHRASFDVAIRPQIPVGLANNKTIATTATIATTLQQQHTATTTTHRNNSNIATARVQQRRKKQKRTNSKLIFPLQHLTLEAPIESSGGSSSFELFRPGFTYRQFARSPRPPVSFQCLPHEVPFFRLLQIKWFRNVNARHHHAQSWGTVKGQ
jgi:hypothetical protein